MFFPCVRHTHLSPVCALHWPEHRPETWRCLKNAKSFNANKIQACSDVTSTGFCEFFAVTSTDALKQETRARNHSGPWQGRWHMSRLPVYDVKSAVFTSRMGKRLLGNSTPLEAMIWAGARYKFHEFHAAPGPPWACLGALGQAPGRARGPV